MDFSLAEGALDEELKCRIQGVRFIFTSYPQGTHPETCQRRVLTIAETPPSSPSVPTDTQD